MKNLNNFLFPLQAKNKKPAQKPEGYRGMGIKLETLSPVVQKVKALQEHRILLNLSALLLYFSPTLY